MRLASTKIATVLQVKSLVLIILREALPSANIVKKTIAKGIVRIGKKVPFKVGEIIRFFHIDCVFQTFRKAKVESSNLIADTINWIKKPLVKPAVIINKSVSTGHSVPQKMKLKQLGLHTLKVMFTNADQMTPSKIVELKKLIEIEKPLIVAVTELKQKNPSEGNEMDYNIPGYSIHPINLDNKIGRGLAVYSKEELDKSVIQIDGDSSFEEICSLGIRLHGGDLLLFGCV